MLGAGIAGMVGGRMRKHWLVGKVSSTDIFLEWTQINTRTYLVCITVVTDKPSFLFGSNYSFFSTFLHVETSTRLEEETENQKGLLEQRREGCENAPMTSFAHSFRHKMDLSH